MLRLAERADVFLEGFRPGTCQRLGVGYEQVCARNPRIIYCSLTGYGQHGPLRDRAGHDLNYLAESGLLAATTRPGQRPGIPLNVVADFAAGGLLAAFAVLAALRGRDRTGAGSYVDVSMYEGLLAFLQVPMSWVAAGARDPSFGQGLLSGAAPFYDCYETADSRWISVAAMEPKFFAALCRALGLEHLVDAHTDPRRWREVRTAFTKTFASATLEEWMTRLADVDTAVAPVRSLPEAFAQARQADLATEDGKVGPVPRISGFTPASGPVSCAPGSHAREILTEAGWASDEIDKLLADGVVHQASQPCGDGDA